MLTDCACMVSKRAHTYLSLTGADVRPRKHSDEDILTATRQCVLDHGAQVSTELIADAAGVSRATLFKRFGTKDNLLHLALCTQIAADWLDRLNTGPAPGSIREQIKEFAVALVYLYREHLPSLITWRVALSAQGLPKQEESGLPMPTRLRDALTAWVVRAQAQERMAMFDAKQWAVHFFSGCQAPTLRAFLIGEDIDDESYVETFIETLWKGCAPC